MANRQPLNDDIEGDVLNTVPGFEDGLDTDLPDNDMQGGGDEPLDTLDADEGVRDGAANQPAREKVDPKKKDPQEQQQVRYDAQGNVIDAQGRVVAPAGRYRRLDEQNKRYKNLLENANKQLVKAREEAAVANYLNGAPAKLGLNHEEVAAGLDMVATFKRSPEQAVQMVLAEAAARGVDLNKLLGDRIGAVQTDAIKRLLDERLAPIDQAAKAQQEQRRVMEATEVRYNEFLSRYPDASAHQDAIAHLMREQNLSEVEAYFRIREFARINGLDFNGPLGPQIQRRVAQQRQQQGDPRRQQHRSRPMVNGRAPANRMVERRHDVASPDRSYGSIVEEALAEAGLN